MVFGSKQKVIKLVSMNPFEVSIFSQLFLVRFCWGQFWFPYKKRLGKKRNAVNARWRLHQTDELKTLRNKLYPFHDRCDVTFSLPFDTLGLTTNLI